MLVEQCAAKGNQIRGLIAECGLFAANEMPSLRCAIPSWLEDADDGLSASFLYLLDDLW